MSKKLAWGIIGTGAIARKFAKSLPHSKTGVLVAIGSRSQEKADEFGGQFGVSRCHGSYEALLADPEVQAVYISTPHPMHAEWAIKAAEAKKHILCEKPITLNRTDTLAVIEAARRNDVFLMEAFMYRCHPQTAKLVELLKEKVIGDVKIIQAAFSFHANVPDEQRLVSNELGGGGILDVGCYAVSMSRLVAGIELGKDFEDPIEVKAFGQLHPRTGADTYAVGILKFPGDILAQVSTGVSLNQDNAVRIYGTKGNIVLPWPWCPAGEGGSTKILLTVYGQPTEEIVVETSEWLYGIEADTVAANLESRQAASPAMTWADSLGNITTLDRWREQIGVVYNAEKPENLKLPISRKPLAPRPGNNMKYGKIQGVTKPVSRLVMGVDNQGHFPSASMMYDDFFEQGGNCFDTAYIYGGGSLEKNLGLWMRNRGNREQVVVLGKGAHTPECDPVNLTKQLMISLDRLQTDYVDIYMMHRDNLDIPVAEFIDVLNDHVKAGRMRAFGGSNWTCERVAEANAYAKSKGLVGFSAVSNNFSLARMVDAPWAGCIASSDAKSIEWFTQTQIPIMSWSSQARGFFSGIAKPEDRSNADFVRCWYSDDNFQRLERAEEVARQIGVPAINVALAYVLCQPFPTFALIGPRALSETWTCLSALDIQLTPDQLKWLNLE